MSRLLVKAIIFTFLIIAPLIITTSLFSRLSVLSPQIKILVWIGAGVLSIITILIVSTREKRMRKTMEKPQVKKDK